MGLPNTINGIQPFVELHQGPTANVYKGYQASLDRYVLLKVLQKKYTRNAAFVARFEAEARIMAKLQSPNVVQVYAFGNEQGTAYLAAEYIEGFSLDQLVREDGLPASIAVYILMEVAKGLKVAHQQGVLHRDIKPSNILVSHEGHVKLTDFGFSTLAGESLQHEGDSIRGTLPYLAPELVLSEPPCAASDFFSLGATFYEMLTGHQAFVGNRPSEILDEVLHFDPLPSIVSKGQVPPQLIEICRLLLNKKAEDRVADADQLLNALQALRSSSNDRTDHVTLQSYLSDPDAFDAGVSYTDQTEVPATKAVQEAGHAQINLEKNEVVPSRKPAVWTPLIGAMMLGGLLFLAWLQMGSKGPVVESQAMIEQSMIEQSVVEQPLVEQPPLEAQEPIETPPDSLQADLVDKEIRDPDAPGISDPGLFELNRPERSASGQQSISAKEGVVDREEASQEELPELEIASADSVALLSDTVQTVLDATLTGTISVVCLPWCSIYVGADSVGFFPPAESLVLLAGTHDVRLRNPDFPDYTVEVDIGPGEHTELRASFWEIVGKLDLKVMPWAEVYLDDRYVGDTPLDNSLVISPGDHKITLKHPVLGDWKDTIHISAGESLKRSYNLHQLLDQ